MMSRSLAPLFSKKFLHSFLFLGLAGAVSACSSDPTLYTVAVVPGAAMAGGPSVVEVRTPVVAQRLDRDTIVKADKGYHMTLASGDSWSEPLGDMLSHVLRTDLAARLPGTTVFAQNDAVTTVPAAFVELTVSRFEADVSGYAIVSGALSVHPAGTMASPVLTYPVQWQSEAPVGHGTDRLVAALSEGVGAIADQAAEHLRNIPSSRLP